MGKLVEAQRVIAEYVEKGYNLSHLHGLLELAYKAYESGEYEKAYMYALLAEKKH